MSGPNAFQIANTAVHFFLALVWATVAQSGWRFRRVRQPRSRFFHILPILAAIVAANYGVFTLITLIPADVDQWSGGFVVLYALNDCNIFIVVALARHLSRYFPTPEEPPPRPRWLAINYGSALLMCVLTLIFVGLLPAPFVPPRFPAYRIIRVVYQLVMLGLIVWRLVRIARPGVWRPGGASWVARRADVVVLGGGLMSLGSWLLIAATTDWLTRETIWTATVWTLVLDTIAGVGFAIPLAVRTLGAVVRAALVTMVLLAATLALYIGARSVMAIAAPEFQPVIGVLAVFAIILLFIPGQSVVRAAIDRVVFRRRRRQREELQAFVQSLSLDVGVSECCRRALGELVAVLQLRGAAMLLDDGEAIVGGAIDFAPFERLWCGSARARAFPTHALMGFELRELSEELTEALSETDIVGVVPITSRRRKWGLLLISASFLGAPFSDEDEDVLQGFADQLALVLDGTQLLARAVAGERALAHREKLAAIGELAARIAHEIRNPVTAARSLAQLLAHDPTSPLNAEHAGLILGELERVERQIAALLRFTRREEFHFEPVDLGELVMATVEQFRARFDAAEIAAEVHAAERIVAPADRERLRQVLINLIENAIDALGDVVGPSVSPRTLTVAVTSANGTASVRVTDNGPGVPPDVLPHLFEPFFSLKRQGTGLGLAIAKRTMEAHGGRIEAVAPSGSGLTLRIDLPLVHAE